MLDIQNRLVVKKQLLSKIEELKQDDRVSDDSPLIDLELKPQQVRELEVLTITLEKLNSHPRPLLYGGSLLDGSWLLQYSTAREIRALKSLPLGLSVGKIYQTIDINTASFENKAWVRHSSGLLSGYVRVTATFEPSLESKDELPDRKINIDFQQRFIGIDRVLGMKTNLLDPLKVVKARNPQGRIPSLDVTYIDETMRIGRGGDGSLFILTKV